MKRIAQFIIGAGLGYGAGKFGALTFTLLASGQFFTTILAMYLASICAVASILLILEACDR